MHAINSKCAKLWCNAKNNKQKTITHKPTQIRTQRALTDFLMRSIMTRCTSIHTPHMHAACACTKTYTDANMRLCISRISNRWVSAERDIGLYLRRQLRIRVRLAGVCRGRLLEALNDGHQLHAKVGAVKVLGVDRFGAVRLEPHQTCNKNVSYIHIMHIKVCSFAPF